MTRDQDCQNNVLNLMNYPKKEEVEEILTKPIIEIELVKL